MQVWHRYHFAAVLCEMCVHINLLSLVDMLPPPPLSPPSFFPSLSPLSLPLSFLLSLLFPDVFSPLAIFVPHVSYHSASVQWATAHINVSFSHTYHVSYSILFSNSSSNNSIMATRIQHATIGDVYSISLSSLLPNTTYISNIVSSSEIYGEMRFDGPMVSTLPYRKLIQHLVIPVFVLPLLAVVNHCHGI